MNMSKFFLSRNFRYGSLATALTLAFVILLVAVNAIFSGLCDKLGWYIDMTNEMAFTLSDAAKGILDDVDSDIKIIFCSERDKVESSSSMYYVHHTARALAWEYDNIEIEYINAYKDPNLVEKYLQSANVSISANSVIIESGSEYKVLKDSNFFTWDSYTNALYAYNGEQTFVAAIMSVTASEAPIAYITTGHKESITGAFAEVLANAGFEVLPIDLKQEEIDENARLIIINDPEWDFSSDKTVSADTETELEKIDKFLSRQGALMVFVSPDNIDKMTNLNEYLYSWGIVLGDGVVRDHSQSVSIDGYSLLAEYGKGTYVESLYTDISDFASAPKPVIRYAAPITYPNIYKESVNEDGSLSGTYTHSGNNSSRYVAPLCISSAGAEVVKEGSVLSSEGNYPLLVMSCDSKIVNGTYLNSYILAAGTVEFTSPDFINSGYANENILYTAMRAMGTETAMVDIPFKPLTETKIEGMTTAQANSWTLCLTVIIPCVTLIFGLYVCVRRKYK